MAGVDATVARAFAARLGTSMPGLAAERDVSGASGPLEEGVALPPGPALVGPSSDGSLTPVGLDWFAVPQGWSILAAKPGDVLLHPSGDGKMVLVPDVVL